MHNRHVGTILIVPMCKHVSINYGFATCIQVITPTCQYVTFPCISFIVRCLWCNHLSPNHEDKLHLEMPIQSNSISQFLMDFEFPNVLEDYRCPTCNRLGNKRETMTITVPAPYLVFHKIGGGEVRLEEHIVSHTVSLMNISPEYLYCVIPGPSQIDLYLT